MQGDQAVSWLMFFTLVAGLAVITGAFLYHLRSQRNRDIAAEALAVESPKGAPTPHGAGLELIGVGAFAIIIMGLLAVGYGNKTRFETAQQMPPVGGGGMAQPAGKADQPKQYQPANPAPDARVPPSGSTSGEGPSNGGRPESTPK